MHVMNKARTMMLEWGEAFLPFVSQGLGKTIVEGYQEMMNDGIRFPPLTESNKWTPCTQLVTPEKPVTSDVKDFYRHIKQAMGTIEEKGTAYFQTNEGTKVLEECRRRLPEMDAILTSASDESTLQHVKKLKEMCKQVIELGEKVDDDWSDNPHSEDGWDESPTRDLWNESPSQKARSDSHSHSQRTSDYTFSQTAWEEAKAYVVGMGVRTRGYDPENAEAICSLGTPEAICLLGAPEAGERSVRFYGYVRVGIFLYIAVFVSRTVLYCIGRRRFFRCKVREKAMEKPLLQPEYEATLKRVDRSNIISCDSIPSTQPVPFILTLLRRYPLRCVF